jgi:hypothetical protein
VADLPIDAVLARADELARGWAIALIRARPLDSMGDIPLAELALEGPSLCAQVVRAVQSDVELDRLTGQGAPTGREETAPARRLAAMAGARDAAAAVEAVEALRGVLWEVLLDELRWPIFDRSSARQVADISDRLAFVCASALAATIAAAVAAEPGLSLDDGDVVVAAPDPAAHGSGREPPARAEAVIVDERAGVSLPTTRAEPYKSPPTPGPLALVAERPLSWDESRPIPPRGSPAQERPLSWDESPPVPPGTQPAEIEIRDERGEEGPAAWIGSIGCQLERFEQDELPFAVLLVELLNIERMRREEPPAELARLAGQVEDALAAELRPLGSGSLTCESPGRYWLLAPETDRPGARKLAECLAQAVASSVRYRGGQLEVVVGEAVCPEDGLHAPALAAHADVGLYAARSAARSSSGRAATSVDKPA